jgi:DNA-binding SARP family transcriptional activator
MSDSPIEIRILGPLAVARADGSAVPPEAWRTRKCADLLRILALERGRPVRTSILVDLLWPEVDPRHGRGSLRTATSMLRKALGQDHVQRQQAGLALVSAVVDADEYHEIAVAITQAGARQDHHGVLLLTEVAENIYRGDFHADADDSAGWAVFAREEFRRLRLNILAHATQSAMQSGRFREALDLAYTTVHIDPSSESAHRALMRAHAEMGEIGRSLRIFESYRERLADELGVDPSQSIRDLHLHLLQDPTA